MGKFYGSLLFFLVAVILNYVLNLPAIDGLTQIYLSFDSFEGAHVIAAFTLLLYPFNSFWIIPSWLIAGFLSGLLCRSWKVALLISILMGVILSITWLFLLSRYLPNYWVYFLSTHSFLELLGQSVGMGLLLGALASGSAVIGAYLTTPKNKIQEGTPIKEIQYLCPHCGTVFQSKPKFCYNCNSKIATDESQV
jgi:hypothetical protein